MRQVQPLKMALVEGGGAIWPYGRGGGERQALNLRHRRLRPLEKLLHFFHINLRRRIVLVPHHLLDPGRGRVPQTVHDDARLLHTH